MTTLDSSIVNVALPTMAKELNTSMAGIEWVVTSYLITICATILLFGKLGDILGKTRIFKIGIGVFTIGSLLCGLSNTLFMLILSMSTVEKNELGIAGSINGLVRNLGTTTGIALSTSILYSRMSSKLGYKFSGYVDGRADVFIYAMRFVFVGIGLICLIGAILSIIRVVKRRKK